MIIHDYESRSGKELVKDYILNLPEEEKIDGLASYVTLPLHFAKVSLR